MQRKQSNNIQLPVKGSGRSKSKPKPSSIWSRATDQVTSTVRNRYGGSKAIVNMAGDLSRLMSVINSEDKHVETFLSASGSTCTNTTAVFIPILPPAQGTTSETRIGNSIKTSRLDYTLQFQYGSGTPATTGILTQVFRYFILRYTKTPSGAGTTPPNISEFLVTDPNSQYTPLSLADTDTNENFVVLDTGLVNIDINVTPTSSALATKIVTGVKQVDFHQDFNSTTAASVCNNSLFYLVVGLYPSNTGGTSVVGATFRQWFIDN